MAVELADLEGSTLVPMLHRHPCERDVLLEDRRARPTGHDAHLLATSVHTVAVAGRFVPLQVESDERPLRVGATLAQRLAPT